MKVLIIPHPGLCQGLIGWPKRVCRKISDMTGGTATVNNDGSLLTVAAPDMSLMTLREIQEEFASAAVPSWEAVRVIE